MDVENDKVGATPLMVLRHFITNNKVIGETEKMYIFGDIAYYKSAKTNYPIFGTGKEVMTSKVYLDMFQEDTTEGPVEETTSKESVPAPKEYYTLESLKYFLDLCPPMQHTQYVRRVIHDQIERPSLQTVTRVDRNPLLEYLTGRLLSEKCPTADPGGPIELPLPAPGEKDRGKNQESMSHNNLEQLSPPMLTCQANRDAVLNSMKLPEVAKLFEEKKPDLNSLLAAMGKDKIMELKTKRRATKAHQVVKLSRSGFDDYKPIKSNKPKTKEQEEAEKIAAHERVYNTRNSILRTNKKEFLSSITNILFSLELKDERVRKFGHGAKATSSSTYASSIQPPPVKTEKSTPYSRYDQKGNVALETDEFGINPLQSFSKSFAEGVQETLEGKKTDQSQKPEVNASSSSSSVGRPQSINPPPSKKLRRDLTPIIIVPDSAPSLITILNAATILEGYSFVSEAEKKNEGAKKMGEVVIHHHKSSGPSVPYKIITSPERKLTVSDWDRVVAIFVTGKKWQFKGWPMDQNPSEICTRWNAYHLKYDDAETDPNVKQWPVQVITMNRVRRHQDKAAITGFWNSVEGFISRTKPHLRY